MDSYTQILCRFQKCKRKVFFLQPYFFSLILAKVVQFFYILKTKFFFWNDQKKISEFFFLNLREKIEKNF
jgi:hypothetical protein